ncbi:MAG TPA: 5-deoxy-glucuronate isomerase [Candidatus Paceibacterota bacterium]
MKYLNFKLLELTKGTNLEYFERELETVLVIINGSCVVELADKKVKLVRRDVFLDKAGAVYVPLGMTVTIKADMETTIAACRAQATDIHPHAVILPEAITEEWRGKDGYRRRVFNIVNTETKTHRLAVGETINEPGQWSSFPPHKHDDRMEVDGTLVEVPLEEIYYFRIEPKKSFAFQRLYTKDGTVDRNISIRDGSVVEIERGYHPVVSQPGSHVYYLWMLAGDERTYIWNTDPDYRHLL